MQEQRNYSMGILVIQRVWEVQSCAFHHRHFWLENGWEPFATTVGGPSRDRDVTLYLRKLMPEVPPSS